MERRTTLALACGMALAGIGATAHAANWLMLQGTEPAGTAERAYVWGFIQADYQVDTSDPNATGDFVPPKLLGPDLTSQKAFNVSRARVGVRGAPIPLDNNVNYFLLVELGNNGITQGQGGSAKFTDASVTLNHVPGARARLGLFKYPGAEEGLQAIQVFDYINFSEVTNQLMLERFPNRVWTPNIQPCDPQTESRTTTSPATAAVACDLNGFDRPVGAFRDVGLQVFDAFRTGGWEHSYAAMIGNGNGLSFSDVDSDKDLYLYLSTEKVFGGEGPFREGMKFFVWSQSGKRQFDGNNDGRYETYDRDRTGVGVKYFARPWRFTAEYMDGKGMIFNGPDKPTWALTTSTTNPDGADNGLTSEGSGWYAESGWYIPGTNWELDLRYDLYKRLDGSRFQLDWKAWTVGTQYHLNKKTRITVNYTARDVEAVNFGTGAGPNANLDGIKDRYGIQLTAIF